MRELLRACEAHSGCVVHPPIGLPAAPRDPLALPQDLVEFYALAGGLDLFVDSDYPFRIVAPTAFRQANSVIVGEPCHDDVSSGWYIIADDCNGDHLSIDLSPRHRGRCYDSFSEIHGVVGSMPIIALSFSDLLDRLCRNRGARPYWLRQDFVPIGDAYDD